MGTGVILACGYVHMLLPSTESLTSPCVPEMFNSTFPAFSYLFALIAGFFMHFLDEMLTVLLDNFIITDKKKEIAEGDETKAEIRENDEIKETDETQNNIEEDLTVQLGASLILEEDPRATKSRKVVEAYVTEFALSVHSIFVGFAVGVVGSPEIEILTIALVFHQFFEGLATGGRVVDAKFSRLNELALVFIFSISAPIGIAIGTGVASVLNTNGPTFLLVQGIFDGFCSGLLIYIGYSLLLIDFPRDVKLHCRGKYRYYLMAAMFIAMWVAAGLMSFIGRYL